MATTLLRRYLVQPDGWEGFLFDCKKIALVRKSIRLILPVRRTV